MLRAFVRTYSDPQELEKAYSAASVELTPTRAGHLQAKVAFLMTDQLWLQQVFESAPRIKWSAQSPQRAFLRFRTAPGPEVIANGMAFQQDEIIYHSRGHAYYEHSTGSMHWGALSMLAEDMAAAGIALTGCDLGLSREPVRITPSSRGMARLRAIHAEVGALVENAPQLLHSEEVRRGVEQLLIEAVVDCLSRPEASLPTRGQRSQETVLRRFRRLLESDPDRAFYIPEVCTAIAVPERTLRLCCQEQLGMSPKQYLLLRRMHLAQRALRAAMPLETTVTEVATRFGFWHFGRFAGLYQLIFGELPSVTLKRPAK